MPVLAYPFEVQDTTETQYQRILRETQDDGVADVPGGPALRPTVPGGNMRVNVANGYAWARGLVMEVTGGAEFVTLTNGGASARTDLVVCRYDAANNAGTLVAKVGPGGATLPALTITDTVWEFPLASVAVAANATTLSAANLTDLRQFTSTRVGIWTNDTRPGTRGTPAPRVGTFGLNVTTPAAPVWEVYGSGGWVNAATYMRMVDLILPSVRPAATVGAPPLAPAYNLLDGTKVFRSDSPPGESDGQAWDVWLEW